MITPVQDTVSYEYPLCQYPLNSTHEYEIFTEESDGECNLFVNGTSNVDTAPDTSDEWGISTDGVNFITLTQDRTVKNVAATPLINQFRPLVKSISGSARQTGLRFIAPTTSDTHFYWEFEDSDATDILNGYEHDDYCDYIDPVSYTHLTLPTILLV